MGSNPILSAKSFSLAGGGVLREWQAVKSCR